METSTISAAKRVAAGAAKLDEHWPDWWLEVLSFQRMGIALDMAVKSQSVIALSWALSPAYNWAYMLRALGFISFRTMNEIDYDALYKTLVAFGYAPDNEDDALLLTDVWHKVVRERYLRATSLQTTAKT
jgi:hypothetical protein